MIKTIALRRLEMLGLDSHVLCLLTCFFTYPARLNSSWMYSSVKTPMRYQ